MRQRTVLVILALAAIAIGWYLFRPERLFVNTKVDEKFPAVADMKTASADSSPVTLLQGRFHGVAHEGVGTATIHRLDDGKRILRLTDFKTSNGPDLRVYLTAANDANDSDTVKRAGFVELGSLKGNIGDQNYDVPSDIDLDKYRSVTIWCRRFGVNFTTAPLTPLS